MTDSPDLFSRVQQGLLASIDVHFAKQIAALENPVNPEVVLAAALASRATGDGHVCLVLASAARQTGWPPSELPALARWEKQLRGSKVIGRPGDFTPLVLDEKNRLYLYRYWQYEQRLIDGIRRRLAPSMLPDVDWQRLRDGLARLFPTAPAGEAANWQKLAAMVAVVKPFCVVSGGPGTGKTHTIAKILALLLEQAPAASLRIFLAAPTGKAAARLGESLQSARESLACAPAVRAAMPAAAATLHRLLKAVPGSPYFRHHSENPLPADVVVVDEASMVDLALMSKLVQALPGSCRLILVGDRDQLASVEAGAALGDICGRGVAAEYSETLIRAADQAAAEKPQFGRRLPQIELNIRDSVVQLVHSYRFSETGRIGSLSRAINRGDADAVLSILQEPADPSIFWYPDDSRAHFEQIVRNFILDGYGPVAAAGHPVPALEQLNGFRLLCAVRKGRRGVAAINRIAERFLRAEHLIAPADGPWYAGRPILITENDYSLGLFNGDIGLAADDSNLPEGPLQVWFPGAEGAVRQVPSFRIGAHETVFAMTVHKSQGSEFEHVLLVLPETDTPVLTRELIYTAVTRARRSVTIWAAEKILRAAVARKIDRSSGLRDALWGQE
ncbi:MAG TPA: exodeoxyribonuclease V subunit alpha [Desulfobacterales bacterium]